MPIGQYYLRLLVSRWKLLAAIVASCTLAAWLVSTLLLAQFPGYDGAARLNIVPTSQELGFADRFVRGSTFGGSGVLLQTYAEYAHTRPIVAPIVDRYIKERARLAGQPVNAWIAENSAPSIFAPGPWISWLNYGWTPPVPMREQLLNKLVNATALETIEGTYLLRVTVRWNDPVSAAWFANALADSIVEQAEDMSAASDHAISGTLAANLATAQHQLDQKLRASRRLKDALGVVDIDSQKQALLTEQITEQTQLTSDRSDYTASKQRVAQLEKRRRGKLSLAQQAVEQLLATEEPKLDGLAHGLVVREARLGQIAGQIAKLAASEQAVKTLDDDIATLRTQVTSLQERVSFNQNENIANAPRIRMIERAVPPLVRSTPKTLLITALGFVAGCALAGCWLLLFDGAALPPAPEPAKVPNGEDGGSDGEAPIFSGGPDEAPFSTALSDEPPAETAAAQGGLRGSAEPGHEILLAEPEVVERAHADDGSCPSESFLPHDETVAARQEPKGRPLRIARSSPSLDLLASTLERPHADALCDHSDGVCKPTRKLRARREPSEHRPIPLGRAVEPADASGRFFPGRLQRPADRRRYRAAEIATLGCPLIDWLAVPLAVPGKPLIVMGTGGDADAKLLCQLVDDLVQSTGEATQRIDGTLRPLDELALTPGARPLIYGGGCEESARLPLLTEGDADVLFVVARHGVETGDVLAELGRSIAELADRSPYVVVLDD